MTKCKDTDESIILKSDQIAAINEDIKKRCKEYNDLSNISFFSKAKILKYIQKYSFPELPKYENDTIYTKDNTFEIIDNLNIEKIKGCIGQRGIIIQRTNLRSFPTNKHFYDDALNQNFDVLQESELLVNTPVIIIHESKDLLWAFVISPFYAGWILKSSIALASLEDWHYFLHNNQFIIITEDKFDTEDTCLDMSVSLPVLKENKENFEVAMPSKDINNKIAKKIITIPKSICHLGFLEYTYQNLLNQALKYKGAKYSWGGLDESVDCSSFVGNVYRCFGFYFPRNTSSQKISIGKSLFVFDKTIEEKRQIIEDNGPCLLFRPGHVMLYLGKKDNKNYIIHASGQALSVIISEVDIKVLSTLDRIAIVK